MKYAIMVLALVGVLARPTAAIADATGNQMLKWCQTTASLCQIFAQGWRSGHDVVVVAGGLKLGLKDPDAIKRTAPTQVCFPQEVISGQLGDVIMNHLRDPPEKRHRPMTYISLDAFTKAFPC